MTTTAKHRPPALAAARGAATRALISRAAALLIVVVAVFGLYAMWEDLTVTRDRLDAALTDLHRARAERAELLSVVSEQDRKIADLVAALEAAGVEVDDSLRPRR